MVKSDTGIPGLGDAKAKAKAKAKATLHRPTREKLMVGPASLEETYLPYCKSLCPVTSQKAKGVRGRNGEGGSQGKCGSQGKGGKGGKKKVGPSQQAYPSDLGGLWLRRLLTRAGKGGRGGGRRPQKRSKRKSGLLPSGSCTVFNNEVMARSRSK